MTLKDAVGGRDDVQSQIDARAQRLQDLSKKSIDDLGLLLTAVGKDEIGQLIINMFPKNWR